MCQRGKWNHKICGISFWLLFNFAPQSINLYLGITSTTVQVLPNNTSVNISKYYFRIVSLPEFGSLSRQQWAAQRSALNPAARFDFRIFCYFVNALRLTFCSTTSNCPTNFFWNTQSCVQHFEKTYSVEGKVWLYLFDYHISGYSSCCKKHNVGQWHPTLELSISIF